MLPGNLEHPRGDGMLIPYEALELERQCSRIVAVAIPRQHVGNFAKTQSKDIKQISWLLSGISNAGIPDAATLRSKVMIQT